MIAAGTIAIAGVARRNSRADRACAWPRRDEPTSSPSAIPIPAAMAKPAASRLMLGHTSDRKSLSARRPGPLCTSLAVGTRNESSARAQSSQMPRAATKTSDAEQRPAEAARGGIFTAATSAPRRPRTASAAGRPAARR